MDASISRNAARRLGLLSASVLVWGMALSACHSSSNGPKLQSISLDPLTSTIAPGGTQRFTTTGTYSDGATKPITSGVAWNSSNPNIATVANGGMVTGVATTTSMALITATVGGISGTASVIVTSATLQSVTVAPTSSSVAPGTSQQFAASAHYSDGISIQLANGVAWTSSNSAVATVDATGLAQGLTAGSATITASYTGSAGTASLTVTQAALQSLAISPASPSIPAGATQQFTATGRYSDGTTGKVTSGIVWRSSNTAVATVDGTGLATALAAGTTTLTATATGGITNTALLTVSRATLTYISISPASPPAMGIGLSQKFTATAYYSDNTGIVLTAAAWESSNAAVVSVDGTGLARSVSPGTATITATDPASGLSSAPVSITVTTATLQSITVSPASATIAVGATKQLTATGNYSDGTKPTLTGVVWSSSSNGVATVDIASGLATGVSEGSVTVTATDARTGFAGVSSLAVGTVAPLASSTDLPYAGQASTTLKFYQITELTPGTHYAFTITNMTDALTMNVYSDAAFSSLLCTALYNATTSESCTAPVGASGTVYIAVDGSNTTSGATFTLTAPLATPPTLTAPVITYPTGLPLAGSVGTGLTYYKVTGLVPGTNYVVRLFGLTADVILLVYGDPYFYSLLCSDECLDFDDFCTAPANSDGELYVSANGFRTTAGSSYSVELAVPLPLTASLAIGNFPAAASVDTGRVVYQVTGLTGGKTYTVSLTELSASADLYVYDAPDLTHLICSSALSGTDPRSCSGPAPYYGDIYVVADGQHTTSGATFKMNVVP